MSKNNSRKLPPNAIKVLFADDEVPLQELIADELPRMGFTVTVCPDGLTAVAALERNSFDCMVVDLDMPGLNGIEVIERAKQISPETEAIVLTGKSSKETAIAALRLGAFDYLQKPCTLVELQTRLLRVAEKREMTRRIYALERRLQRAEGNAELIGEHPSMKQLVGLIGRVAPTGSSVLIHGETGTGKELVAQAIHKQSERCDGPFLAVNCGAFPENLIESELFGHRKGAFTGAEENRVGLFEVADGGTLFLDEIAELPKAMQSKLLRVLESGEVRRIGDNHPFRVDVRIVSATHRHLPSLVEKDLFRQDLMYRINTFELNVPALRDRSSDLELLVPHLLSRYRNDARQSQQILSPPALQVLQRYSWPGNIRELANVLEYASILCDRLPIGVEHLPPQVSAGPTSTSQRPLTLAEIEMRAIMDAIERHRGNKTAAAQELGVSIRTLYNKLGTESGLKVA